MCVSGAVICRIDAALSRRPLAWSARRSRCCSRAIPQLIMWDVVKATPQQGYVANPHTPPGSIHNTGCAVDLSV